LVPPPEWRYRGSSSLICLCNAHIIRELKAILEFDKLALAEELRQYIKKMIKEVAEAKKQGILGLKSNIISDPFFGGFFTT
jgi:hypothetical protein